MGVNPQHVVPSWDLTTLWVTNNAEHRTDGTLTPIDPVTGKPGPPVAVDDPYNMYFTPDGRSAIVVAEALKRLDFRDPKTMALQGSVAAPGCAGINHGDYSIDGKYLLMTCEYQGRLVKIDWINRKVLGYLKLSGGGIPQDIRISPDGKVFYVAELKRGGVYLIDGDAFKEIGFVKTGVGAHGLYPSRDGTKLYVANRGSSQIGGKPKGPGSVAVVDFATRTGRDDVADPERRQPRHGQRQRRRQAALALGALRQRRVRDRHDHRRGRHDSGGQGAARPHGVATTRSLLARPHRQHALRPCIFSMPGIARSV